MRYTKLLIFATIGVSALAIGFAVAHRGEAGAPPLGTPRSTFSLEAARAFRGFSVYYAGDSVDGNPLVAVLRRNDTANYISFIYGDCQPSSDSGCAPPAEIQIWPACMRNPSLYGAPLTPAPDTATIRGVPAAFFENGMRLELQTGISTVVIFGNTRDLVTEITSRLRGVNINIADSDPLPPPRSGATEGTLSCG